MKLPDYCTRVIEYSFYALFLLVPLTFNGGTSELFELNKMWLTFGLTIVIAAAWITKMIAQRKVVIQRTPIDIALLLFLLSQILSTIFSLDQYVSWWGYYSRFNGGLFSTLCYILLYYAFVSNLGIKHVLRTLKVSLISGLFVALWGFPSHFGADPTCLVFRGSLDTSCWTEAFKPTIRAFSTLGQPAWFAAYLALLIPLALAYAINNFKRKVYFSLSIALALLFYIDLLFASTRAGFIAFFIANIIFWAVIFFKKVLSTKHFLQVFLLVNILFVVSTFLFGLPINSLQKFTLPELQHAAAPAQNQTATTPATAAAQTPPAAGSSITDSGDIRLYVWQGAISAWKAHPLFGTGVETFAFAYYQFKPVGHNLTSEWDFLYNKAHNEYLNYLTTTGIFGLGSYLLIIGLFSFFTIKAIVQAAPNKKPKEKHQEAYEVIIVALFAGWISILISNFFGFSVVIINLYLFLIPAFVFILAELLHTNKRLSIPANTDEPSSVNAYQWTAIVFVVIIAGWNCIGLLRYWYADTQYALGANFDRVGSYQEAYPLLLTAVKTEPTEPTYADELAINLAVLSTALAAQKDSANAEQFANNAIALDNQVIENHPNDVVYLKNRVRLFYTLAQGDKKNQTAYYAEALKAIQQAALLAPTDAKISYNLGVLSGQIGDVNKGISVLQQTIKLKPDYRDAYFALGLFYHEKALDKNGNVVDQASQQKAIETYQYILKNLGPTDSEVQKSLKDWGA